MGKLLVVVDMQNDFIDGALGTGEAKKIVDDVVRKIKQCEERRDRIVFTMDTHGRDYLETQEGRKLPVSHCIKGTRGWEICDQIKEAVDLTRYKIYEKGTFGSDEYGMELAHGLYKDITEVELVGLCTDICVISNAVLTKTFLKNAVVIVDAQCCAGVTCESHRNALEAMKMCHIEVVND